MKKRIIGILLSVLMIISCLGSITAGAAENTDSGAVLSSETVLFVNGSSTVEGDGDGSLENPYKNFNTAAAKLAESGGTIVVTGVTDCATTTDEQRAVLGNSGDITVTSVYNNVDYRGNFTNAAGTDGAYLSVASLLCNPVETPGKITFDSIDIVTPSWANWHLCGHGFEATDTVKIFSPNGSGAYGGAVVQYMTLGSNVSGISAEYGVLPEIKISASASSSSRIYLGARQNVTVGGASFVVNANIDRVHMANNGNGTLNINGDVKIVVNKKLSSITGDTTLGSFIGDLSIIANPGSTAPTTIPAEAVPTEGNWFIVNAAQGGTLAHGERGRNFVLTLADSSAYNFAILENTTSGNSYAFPITDGVGNFTLSESGVYSMSYVNKDAVTVSFVDEVYQNTVSDAVTTADVGILLPKFENTDTHIFRGWTDVESGTEVKYEIGSFHTFTENTTLYAVWSDAPKYTVTFMVDGETYSEFVNIEGAKIEYPTEPSKDGYYFQKWDITPEVIGTQDITINAVFVDKADYGNVVYLDGTAATGGNGSIGSPFKTLKNAAAPLLDEGGTIVVKGVTTIEYSEEIDNYGDILVTSLDPITGNNYIVTDKNGTLDDGAYLRNYKGAFLGNGVGKITFDNVALYATKSWNFYNFSAGETVIGANTKFYLNDNGTLYKGGYFGLASVLVDDMSNINIKATIAAPASYYSAYLARIGEAGATINSANVTLDTYVKFSLANNNDSHTPTLNGPVMITVNSGGTNSRIIDTNPMFIFGAKSYLSIITNNATVTYDGASELAEKTYRISSGADGSVTHTATKGKYKVVSDTHNFAQLLDADGNVVSETVIGSNGGTLTATEYGEYTVAYSTKDVYTLKFVSSVEQLSDAMPEEYAVAADNAEGLTITLPSPETRTGYSFKGWAESENGEVKYAAGDSYTLNSTASLYAVWEEILVYTVTFKNDDGETLHTSTGYAGDALTFPESDVLPWDYEKKLLGFYYEDDADKTLIAEDAVIPEADKTALPLWGDIPTNETRVYVNANNGVDTNDGKTPDRAVATIAKAVSLIKDSGGIIVCTDGEITLTGAWNNSGDITLTSLDPLSGIDYRAKEISDDGLSWKSGAYLRHGPVSFGSSKISGKITLDNLVLGTHANYQFLNFDGHPFELGKGISAFNKASDSAKITTTQTFYMRALGESGASSTNADGITFTLNTLGNGATIYAIGKAENVVPAINITIDSEFSGTIQYGNNSGGGTATLKGPGRFTFNANLTTSVKFPTYTNPVEGNLYAIYNNNSTGSISNIVQADGYGIITVTSASDAKITHGKDAGTFAANLADGYSHKFIKILNSDGNIVQYKEFENGKAEFEISEFGDYTAQYTDVSCHKVTYLTGTDEISVPYAYFEDGSQAELAAGLYRYGYLFAGWTDGENNYTQGVMTMPEKDVVLTAIWNEAPKYTVKFDANGFEGDIPEDITNYVEEPIALAKLSSDTQTFLGWSEDSNAESGIMHHVIVGDTTLYAIWTSDPAYILETHFKDDSRWQFQRYAVDVYIENAKASSGTVKFNIDNSFLTTIGRIPAEGIDSTLTRSGKVCTLTWSGNVDSTDGRIKLARVMLFYTKYGMGYDEIKKRTSDEIVSPLSGCLADGDAAPASANFYKGIMSGEVTLSGKLSLEGRESGSTPLYSYAKLYILDSNGDAVDYIVLEDENTASGALTYETTLYPGSYTLKAVKNGYVTRTVPITVDSSSELPEIVMYSGDTVDENGKGDGKVDVDDFSRVLRGFASDFPTEKYSYSLDLNEDGNVNVSDLSIIKNGIGKVKRASETTTTVKAESMKLLNWSIKADSDIVTITAGSEEAAKNAAEYLENEYGVGEIMPSNINHSDDYPISDIIVGTTSISDYRIVIAEGDEVAAKYAEYVRAKIAENVGYDLEIVYDSEAEIDAEIVIGKSNRNSAEYAEEEYKTFVLNGKLIIGYGDEQSAELGAISLCENILGIGGEAATVIVDEEANYSGNWEVLTRFALLADTHVGKGKVVSNPDWEDYESWLKPVYDHLNEIHANPETELDFVLSLGDNIDYGYDRNTEESDALRDYDYADYLRTIKWLTICDPENPIDGRAEGKIPHYELKGNHDPSGVLRFLDEAYWTTATEDGQKVAFIGFFTNYGAYPYVLGDTSTYFSYGNLTDETVEYIESMILRAVNDGAQHIILSSHFGIAQDLGAPILPETGLGKIGELCDKYGIKLYFNGHEHNPVYTIRKYNDVYDVDCSMTRARYAVVEITTLRAKITIYNSADQSLYREDVIPLS